MNIKIVIGAIASAAVVLVVVAAVMLSGGGINLDDDPRGREACEALVQAQEYSGDAEVGIGSLLMAGEAASKARTEEVRETAQGLAEGAGLDEDEAGGLADFAVVDQDALQAVCEDAGFEFPDE